MIILAHDSAHFDPGVAGTFMAGMVLIGVAVTYLALAALRHREPRGWNRWRTAAFLAGWASLVLGWSVAGSDGFDDHMLGHLLVGMFAPLLFVMSAPVTLILRSVEPRTGKAIVAVLRSAPARVFANPIVLLAASLGGLVLLYFTPLYTITSASPALHQLIHLHFFVTGYLFAWMIAGPDPGPHRPSVHRRILVLGVAVLGHSVLAQLMHAGLFVQVPASPQELRNAGSIMYYLGDIAEIALALAMLLTIRPIRHSHGAPVPQSGGEDGQRSAVFERFGIDMSAGEQRGARYPGSSKVRDCSEFVQGGNLF